MADDNSNVDAARFGERLAATAETVASLRRSAEEFLTLEPLYRDRPEWPGILDFLDEAHSQIQRAEAYFAAAPTAGLTDQACMTEQMSTVCVRTDGPLSDDRAERMLNDPVGYFAAERERVRGDVEGEMAREVIQGRQLRRRSAACTIRRLFGIR